MVNVTSLSLLIVAGNSLAFSLESALTEMKIWCKSHVYICAAVVN